MQPKAKEGKRESHNNIEDDQLWSIPADQHRQPHDDIHQEHRVQAVTQQTTQHVFCGKMSSRATIEDRSTQCGKRRPPDDHDNKAFTHAHASAGALCMHVRMGTRACVRTCVCAFIHAHARAHARVSWCVCACAYILRSMWMCGSMFTSRNRSRSETHEERIFH